MSKFGTFFKDEAGHLRYKVHVPNFDEFEQQTIFSQKRGFGKTHAFREAVEGKNYRFYDIIKRHAIDMVWSVTENAYVESKSKLKFY